MSLRKLCVITIVLAIAASAATETLHVQIKEYEVPTPNSRPHDPALAPDGSLWYTGQAANKVGRLDPRTGRFREYPLKTPDSGPHGLVADKEGNIWFTAISGGYVGKLDPKTGEIAEYRPSDWAKTNCRSGPLHNAKITYLSRCSATLKTLPCSAPYYDRDTRRLVCCVS